MRGLTAKLMRPTSRPRPLHVHNIYPLLSLGSRNQPRRSVNKLSFGSSHSPRTISTLMDPYEADPLGIPPTDRYADIPFYGRYLPRSDDFRVNPEHIRSTSDKSLQYWASVVERCNELVRIYPAAPGGRDVFALGSVIVKSSHLHNADDGHPEKPCYPCADANEIKAIEIAKDHLDGIQVPEIYFSGKVSFFHGTLVNPDYSVRSDFLPDSRATSSRAAAAAGSSSYRGLAISFP